MGHPVFVFVFVPVCSRVFVLVCALARMMTDHKVSAGGSWDISITPTFAHHHHLDVNLSSCHQQTNHHCCHHLHYVDDHHRRRLCYCRCHPDQNENRVGLLISHIFTHHHHFYVNMSTPSPLSSSLLPSS